jgi:radical SAM-linked protein
MIPLPRPVGVASQAEVIVVETELPIDPEEALQQLRRHIPEGVQMLSARALAPLEKLRPESARYVLDLEGPPDDDLRHRVQEILDSPTATIQRTDHETRKTRTIDIRPFVLDMSITHEGVEFTLKMEGQASAKPAEVAALLGFDASSINHRIRRISVQWQGTT